MSKKLIAIPACVVLGLVTLAAFWSALHNGFIAFDDGEYVAQNPHVINGLTWENVRWALQAGYAGNWHPLTWLSLMLDAQLYGHNAMGFHLTNLLLHTANTILLFLILKHLTGAQWRSAFVAALFAVHPLHVESVAWVSERKDVLSTLFFLLTIWAYAAYAGKIKSRNPHPISGKGEPPPVGGQPPLPHDSSFPALNSGFYYVLSLSLLGLGLMSKPMLVTTPFVLLLLDYWPLERLSLSSSQPSKQTLAGLVREKVPFLCLALAASMLTLVAQDRGHSFPTGLPFAPRLANAIVSYWKYLGMTIWPAGLSVFYPHPDIRYPVSEQWPGWLICAGAFGLAALSFGVFSFGRRRPWLVVGWFWFLGTLVPVLGIVQVGDQAMADRYTYIPLIGIFLCVAWGAADLAAGRCFGRTALATCAMLVIAGCAMATHRQVNYWRNTRTLFEHALAVTRNNAPAQFQLGTVLEEQGDFAAAISRYRASLAADPSYIFAYESLGFILERLGKPDEARKQFESALRFAPWWALPHNRLASCLWMLGRREESRHEYLEAVRLDPDYAEAHFNLGVALYNLGQTDDAVAHIATAVRLEPDNVRLLTVLAEMQLKLGRLEAAESNLVKLVVLCPTSAESHINLGGLLMRKGRQEKAINEFAAAVRLTPSNALPHCCLGTLLLEQGKFGEAASQFSEAVKLKPDYVEAHAGLSQSLAAQNNRRNLNNAITPTNADSTVPNIETTLQKQ